MTLPLAERSAVRLRGAGIVQYTTDVVFRRPVAASGPRASERSLVTVSALIATGHVGQLAYHLNRAMDAGLTQTRFM
jgi:4-carboxymuconolactone decarboxylase